MLVTKSLVITTVLLPLYPEEVHGLTKDRSEYVNLGQLKFREDRQSKLCILFQLTPSTITLLSNITNTNYPP